MPKIDEISLVPVRTKQVEVGDRYGRLTIRAVGRSESRRYYAVCDCDCGSCGQVVQIGHLKNGDTKSCGCETRERMTTHALTGNPIFHRWQGMMRRCYSDTHDSYPDYGGRGIVVCERWHAPAAFVADMSEDFSPELELDRVDNDGPYEPGNVRWAPKPVNLDNRRITRKVTFNGETLPLREWSTRMGIPLKLLTKRIYERGWPVERAFATPVLSRSETAKIANAASHASRRR